LLKEPNRVHIPLITWPEVIEQQTQHSRFSHKVQIGLAVKEVECFA
jgi:hypothetical protein